MARVVKRSSVENWSVCRSLAFLAATFAMALAVLLPTAVAASPSVGAPIMLCSGQSMVVVFDEDGVPQPEKPSAADSLKCASCVLAALTALPPPPPTRPIAPPRIVAVQPVLARVAEPTASPRIDWRPPSTAPPAA